MTTLDPEKFPLVSVLIITYNQAHFISETIDSVLSQDYPNLKIVIADDASTDTTRDVLEKYISKYPSIIEVVFNEHNLGITGNCNVGLRRCRGEYVALLGGDDLFLKEKLHKQVRLMESDKEIAISYHAVEIFQSQTNETLLVTNQTAQDTPLTIEDLLCVCIPGSSSILVRANMIPSHGFDPSLPTVSDWLFNIEMAVRGKIAFLPEVLGRYRKHGNQASFRTLELLDESLKNLDIAAERYPDVCKEPFISRGKVRYIQGEIFRRLAAGDKIQARFLCRRAQSLRGSLKTSILYFLSFLPLSKMMYFRFRYWLKKFF